MTTIKELAGAVGLVVQDEEELTLADFTQHLNSKYTLIENVLKDENIRRKIAGRALGALGVKAAQTFGLTKSEIDGKELEEIFATIKTKHTKALELAGADTETNDAKVAELNQLLADKESELQALVAKQAELEEQYKTGVQQLETKMKTYKLNDRVEKAKAAVADKLTEEFNKNKLVRTGFDTHFDSLYEATLDEAEELIVKNKATGEVVKSKANNAKPATLDEVYLQEAEAKGIVKKNNAGAQKPVAKNKLAEPTGTGDVKIHPNAQKRTQLN